MSSTSSTSTRSSSKISRQSSKRSLSPTIPLAVERSSEKRRRRREQRQTKPISDDIEQENGDDEIQLIKMKKPKQRQASNSSIEYVQIIHNDQQSISSLNNIENFKLKSPMKSDDEIIICHTSSPKKKTETVRFSNRIVIYFDFLCVRQPNTMNIFEFVAKFVVILSKDEVNFLSMFLLYILIF